MYCLNYVVIVKFLVMNFSPFFVIGILTDLIKMYRWWRGGGDDGRHWVPPFCLEGFVNTLIKLKTGCEYGVGISVGREAVEIPHMSYAERAVLIHDGNALLVYWINIA